eukprot:EG_transcript_17357
MKRHFIVMCPTTPFDGAFNFQNFLQGRVDMATRSISSALFLSRGMRQDTAITVILQGAPRGRTADAETQVTWIGSDLLGLWPDDKSIATKLQRAICSAYGWPGGAGKPALEGPGTKRKAEELEEVPGVQVTRAPFKGFVEQLLVNASGGHERAAGHKKGRWRGVFPIYLHETGVPGREYFKSCQPRKGGVQFVVVVGGPTGLTLPEEQAVDELGFAKVSFGSPSLFASHCVVLCHHYFDGWCAEHGIDLETEPDGRPPETLNPWRKHRPQVYN